MQQQQPPFQAPAQTVYQPSNEMVIPPKPIQPKVNNDPCQKIQVGRVFGVVDRDTYLRLRRKITKIQRLHILIFSASAGGPRNERIVEN